MRPLENCLYCFPRCGVVVDKVQLQVLRQKGQNSRSRIISAREVELRRNTGQERCFCATDYSSSVLMPHSEEILRLLGRSLDSVGCGGHWHRRMRHSLHVHQQTKFPLRNLCSFLHTITLSVNTYRIHLRYGPQGRHLGHDTVRIKSRDSESLRKSIQVSNTDTTVVGTIGSCNSLMSQLQ